MVCVCVWERGCTMARCEFDMNCDVWKTAMVKKKTQTRPTHTQIRWARWSEWSQKKHTHTHTHLTERTADRGLMTGVLGPACLFACLPSFSFSVSAVAEQKRGRMGEGWMDGWRNHERPLLLLLGCLLKLKEKGLYYLYKARRRGERERTNRL